MNNYIKLHEGFPEMGVPRYPNSWMVYDWFSPIEMDDFRMMSGTPFMEPMSRWLGGSGSHHSPRWKPKAGTQDPEIAMEKTIRGIFGTWILPKKKHMDQYMGVSINEGTRK